nr:transport protein TonB 1 [Catenovulum maritimum]
MEVISVTGVQYSDQKARLIERDKKQFSSVVSTDDIGNFVDQNVAESLRRLPGVTLQRQEGEGKFISVRGLGPQFVSVNMNGAQMAGGGDERKVGLDALAGDALGSIEVVKTLTPDMNLNSIGGAVNVKAISAYERGKNTLKLKAQAAYSDLREEVSPKFSLDGTQFLFDKKVGLGFVVSSEKRSSVVNENRHHSTNEMESVRQNFTQINTDTDEGKALHQATVAANPEIIIPQEFEIRQELADRERNTAALNIEFKPNETSSFFVTGNYVSYTDEDVARREFYRFGSGTGDTEVLYVNDETKEFILSDTDMQHQYFIQTAKNETTTFNFGGEHLVGDAWTIDYDYTSSKSVEDGSGDRRVQFRERDLITYGQAHANRIDVKILSESDLGQYRTDLTDLTVYDDDPDTEQLPTYGIPANQGGGNINDPSQLVFDNLFLEDSKRTDKIDTFNFNVKYDFLDSDWLYYIKAGISTSSRENEIDKNRWSFIPDATACNGDVLCEDAVGISHAGVEALGFELAIPENSDFNYPFVSQAALEYLVDQVEPTKDLLTEGDESYVSLGSDYSLTEDTKEAYVMGEVELAERLTMITGVRYVATEYASTGYMTLRNDQFIFNDSAGYGIDIFKALPDASIKYSEFFPSVHLRYEPSDSVLIRGAVWTSYTRPTFKQSRAFAQFDSRIELCAPSPKSDGSQDCATDPEDFENFSTLELENYTLGASNTLNIGNPNLIPMTAVNYDASVSWYHSEDLFVEAAIFYKDISNFIVDVRGATKSFDDLPLTLPINQVEEFIIPQEQALTNVNFTINGEKATVFGIELSYNHFFESGFFIQSNATIQTSEANLDPSIRRGSVALPDQADSTANLTLGWENDKLNVRVIANHRSSILDAIGSCPAATATQLADASFDPDAIDFCKTWSDRYQGSLKTIDFKAKYNLGGGLSVYLDAINLTDNQDLRYFEGNSASGGNVMYQNEEYGRTVQLGVNYKFY